MVKVHALLLFFLISSGRGLTFDLKSFHHVFLTTKCSKNYKLLIWSQFHWYYWKAEINDQINRIILMNASKT